MLFQFRIEPPSVRTRGGSHWLAMSLMPLRSGYIGSFADPGSDARVIVLVDNQGAIVRERVLDAPLSLVSMTADLRFIIVVRYSDVPEVVFYECRRGDAAT